jgi:hypothetical protein
MYSACADHLKKTRTLVHDAKHRYQIFVLGPQEKVDDGADVIEHGLRICVAHDAVEEVDLFELARVVIGVGKRDGHEEEEGEERRAASERDLEKGEQLRERVMSRMIATRATDKRWVKLPTHSLEQRSEASVTEFIGGNRTCCSAAAARGMVVRAKGLCGCVGSS